uniref:Gypsy retrotransposon integrase-like protein 1 n=1 Tax=Astyanax mexicanus TaxID=7994 RepID=A0A3B1JS97_ASTMX
MEFDLEKFVLCPSVEALMCCKKADLVVAEFYNIHVIRTARKAEIREMLLVKLREEKRLPTPPDLGASAVAQAVVTQAAVTQAAVLPGKESASVAVGEGGVSSVAEAAGHTPRTPSGIDLVTSPSGAGPLSDIDLSMAIKLKELDLAIRQQERETQLLRVRALELEAVKASSSKQPASRTSEFDICKYISLVPPFRESEVDSYFTAFERVAATLQWPKEMWSLLLQCKLVGKAQEVCSSLTAEQSLDYDKVKAAVLRAYELVPEAYRQRFRSYKKMADRTFVEFARDKTVLFEKWCSASKVLTFEQLKELILLEDFKNSVPEVVVVHLNEQKVTTLSEAAVLTDEYVLTHKTVFSVVNASRSPAVSVRDTRGQGVWSCASRTFKGSPKREESNTETSLHPSTKHSSDTRVCFYCRRPGHVIAECTVWNKKKDKPKSMACISTSKVMPSHDHCAVAFRPFILDGFVTLSEKDKFRAPVRILRDTGAAQSFISTKVLPFSEETFCGSYVVVCGIGLTPVSVPLHSIYLQSELVTGMVRVAVQEELPVAGVHFILGNDLAGGKVFPIPEVVPEPCVPDETDALQQEFPTVFSVCVTTRAQKARQDEDLALKTLFSDSDGKNMSSAGYIKESCDGLHLLEKAPFCCELTLPVDGAELVSAQEKDPSLSKCRSAVVDQGKIHEVPVAFYRLNGVLMRKWAPSIASDEWDSTFQIVVPEVYRAYVLSLAHDHVMAGHLGINKTYKRILLHFFWPGLKADVVKYCNSCHACQVAGKPNQGIPPAPLCPIPVVGEPFEHLLLDCVGPLPKSKSGNQYLLTVMCMATRFPD